MDSGTTNECSFECNVVQASYWKITIKLFRANPSDYVSSVYGLSTHLHNFDHDEDKESNKNMHILICILPMATT